MKIEHPAVAFIKEYWEELLIALVIIGLAIALVVTSLQKKVAVANLETANAAIQQYAEAERANLQTIADLTAANEQWANTAETATKIAAEQAALVADKEEVMAKKEATLREQLEKAHAQNKSYSDAIVPDAVARRLYENSRSD